MVEPRKQKKSIFNCLNLYEVTAAWTNKKSAAVAIQRMFCLLLSYLTRNNVQLSYRVSIVPEICTNGIPE